MFPFVRSVIPIAQLRQRMRMWLSIAISSFAGATLLACASYGNDPANRATANGSASEANPATEGPQPMEIGALILEILESPASGGMVDWFFMAEPNSRVEWETVGRAHGRTGQVLLSANGVVPYTLQRNLAPALWEIRLQGPNSGVFQVNLRNAGCHDPGRAGRCEDASDDILSSLDSMGISRTALCEFGPGGAYSKVFRLEGDTKTLYMELLRHAGSAGHSYEITMISRQNYPEIPELAEATSVCAAFFNSGLGAAGNRYLKYKNALSP